MLISADTYLEIFLVLNSTAGAFDNMILSFKKNMLGKKEKANIGNYQLK